MLEPGLRFPPKKPVTSVHVPMTLPKAALRPEVYRCSRGFPVIPLNQRTATAIAIPRTVRRVPSALNSSTRGNAPLLACLRRNMRTRGIC